MGLHGLPKEQGGDAMRIEVYRGKRNTGVVESNLPFAQKYWLQDKKGYQLKVTHSREIEVRHELPSYPYESSSLVLIEYVETDEGREIAGVYVPDSVPASQSEYVQQVAKFLFYTN